VTKSFSQNQRRLSQEATRSQQHQFQRSTRRVNQQQAEHFRRTAHGWRQEALRRIQGNPSKPRRESQTNPSVVWGRESPVSASGGQSTGRSRRSLGAAALAVVLLLGFVLVLGAGISAISESSSSPKVGHPRPHINGTVGLTRKQAKVRSGPGTSYPAVGSLPAGKRVVIGCRVTERGKHWDKLAAPYTGKYVAASLVKSGKPAPCATH
jgi:hypothetical protein